MRAFRPSYFAPFDEFEEQEQEFREATVERYSERARAGLPLFEGLSVLHDVNGQTPGLLTAD